MISTRCPRCGKTLSNSGLMKHIDSLPCRIGKTVQEMEHKGFYPLEVRWKGMLKKIGIEYEEAYWQYRQGYSSRRGSARHAAYVPLWVYLTIKASIREFSDKKVIESVLKKIIRSGEEWQIALEAQYLLAEAASQESITHINSFRAVLTYLKHLGVIPPREEVANEAR